MDEIDLPDDSRRGLRFGLFAALLGAYLITGFLPVSTYTDGNGQTEYVLGHHSFLCGFMSGSRNRPIEERPQTFGLLANLMFVVGLSMLFRGHWLGAAIFGAVATAAAI